MDESTFKLEPYLVKAWFKKGSRPVKKYVLNKSQKIHTFGALGYGIRYTKTCEKINSNKYLPFLRRLKKHHPKLCVVIDNARWHLTKKVLAYMKEAKIKMIRLPPYSPELNPIEQYWKNIKAHLATREYTDKKGLIEEVQKALNRDIFMPKISDY